MGENVPVKKALILSGAALLLVGTGVLVFQEPLKQVAFDVLTQDMFLAEDRDAFDPGLPLGTALPAVNATLAGRSITDLSEFAGPNGMVLIANRSVDW